MDKHSQTTTGCKGQPEEERQNRRQFFNGLGKWSLAIIAAVTALREGVHDLQSAVGSRFGCSLGWRGRTSPANRQEEGNRTAINRILTNRTTIGKSLIETIIVLNDNKAEPNHRAELRR